MSDMAASKFIWIVRISSLEIVLGLRKSINEEGSERVSFLHLPPFGVGIFSFSYNYPTQWL